ncbi:MAG: competence/damage-inducible protein A [Hyphomicrobiales bacterium]|nr:competence/damage-inducible protein A [Hyphomicrobiales bacterium]MDE2115352.1 competence/damage-inducible protein A [Hyphomicrobiales bacterium]
MDDANRITAAILVIGDEILSGRTKEKNIGTIADHLFALGIDLCEARIVADDHQAIVDALNALRAQYTYVFTSGGIGPTHDDITADAVAAAFNVALDEDPRAIKLLLERIKPEDLNPARRRMARIPAGGELIENRISKAPGFMIGNVIVMAGVPSIMQAMLEAVTPRLKSGPAMQVETISAIGTPEGAYAALLGSIATAHQGLSIGSYPSLVDGQFHNQIVIRGRDHQAIAEAAAQVRAMVENLANERAKTTRETPK